MRASKRIRMMKISPVVKARRSLVFDCVIKSKGQPLLIKQLERGPMLYDTLLFGEEEAKRRREAWAREYDELREKVGHGWKWKCYQEVAERWNPWRGAERDK